MPTQESRRVPLAGLLLLAAIVGVVLLAAREKGLVSIAQDQVEDFTLPIADFDEPEPQNTQDKAKRHARNKRYDHRSGEAIKEAPYPVERIWSSHWSRGLPAIPVQQSDVVLIGLVVESQAHLSNDKTGVYSEFGIQVQEVLKGVDIDTLNQPLICAERFGGSVRFPSGVIQKYRTSGQRMPKPGRRYVLFLKKVVQDDDFSILTGYELRGEKIVPLDGSSQQGNERLPFDSYIGVDVGPFLQAVRDAIAHATVVSQ
jgi:hypothetical protein